MARFAYDHTQLVEPNLLIPGKKPVGPVRIDENHPYVDGFEDGYIFGWNPAVSLRGHVVDIVESTSGFKKHALGVQATASVSNASFNSGIKFNPAEGSILLRFTPSRFWNYAGVWDTGHGANDLEMWIYSDGRLAGRHAGGAPIVSGMELNKPIDIGFSWEASGTQYLTANRETASSSCSSALTSAYIYPLLTELNASAEGIMEYFYIYRKQMPYKKMQDILADPYQFLVPA